MDRERNVSLLVISYAVVHISVTGPLTTIWYSNLHNLDERTSICVGNARHLAIEVL